MTDKLKKLKNLRNPSIHKSVAASQLSLQEANDKLVAALMSSLPDKFQETTYEQRQMILESIFILVANGETLTGIGKRDNFPHPATVMAWLGDMDPLYVRKYQAAKAIQAEMFADQIVDIADNTEGDFYTDKKGNVVADHDSVNRAKLKIEARKFMADRGSQAAGTGRANGNYKGGGASMVAENSLVIEHRYIDVTATDA